ncbi:MAG: beta-ketoacyl synthase N-terminal-like domain-containing protein [Bacteroidota bacterium]
MGDTTAWVAPITTNARQEIDKLKVSDPKYKNLDATVLYAIHASRSAIKDSGWEPKDNFGINMGSSRGATALFEKYHQEFLDKTHVQTLTSPTTTLGNISSWVAHDLQTNGPEISHSITCSTALHALLNGMAWIKSGMAAKFLVGGSEAPLTAFTLAQMKALKIYSRNDAAYPCRAMDLEKKSNTMVLGEGASVACLERGITKNTLAIIEGVGYATEPLKHNISISTDALCFQKSMKMALGRIHPEEVDVIVMHAPGTIKGDVSEANAIKKVFAGSIPALTTNKWKIGHTFGASGMLSIEMAVLMLKYQKFIPIPFLNGISYPKRIQKIMVNAVGFGGNAVSILLKTPKIS